MSWKPGQGGLCQSRFGDVYWLETQGARGPSALAVGTLERAWQPSTEGRSISVP